MGNLWAKPLDRAAAAQEPRPKAATRGPALAGTGRDREGSDAGFEDGAGEPAEARQARAAAGPAFSLEALRAEVEELRACPPPYVSRIGTLTVPTLVCTDAGELIKPAGEGPWDLSVSVAGGGLEGEELSACRAAAERAPALRARAREAAEAVAAAERALAEAQRALQEAEGCGAAAGRALFALLPSVGTWLAPRTGDAKRADRLEAAISAVQDAEVEVQVLQEGERQALEASREADARAARVVAADAYDFPFRLAVRFTSAWPRAPPASVRFRCVIHHAFTDDDDGMLDQFYGTLPTESDGRHTVRGLLQAVHGFLGDPLQALGMPAAAVPNRAFDILSAQQQKNEQRLSTIRKYSGRVRHKELFESPPRWREEWFDRDFWRAQQENTAEAWRSILTEHLPGEVFSFRIFTEDFCRLFVEEVFNFYASGLPARRPNSMNNYGIILNEIGLEPMIDELQGILQPLGELLWPGPGSVWDGHHCFIVRYREGEDLGLDMHTDDSDVTFNICLGLDFEGAGLQFCGLMGAANHRRHACTYRHQKGTCVCHLGRKRHGADDIARGERLNLILWNHSHTYRQSFDYTDPPYVAEEGRPDEVCLSYTHDRDYGIFKDYPAGKDKFRGRGWCPPKAYEYAGFKQDVEKGCTECLY